jgi:DNA-directed RNA polymerase specialized sigma24 family protein
VSCFVTTFEFRDIFQNTGKHVIEYGTITISLWDLQDGLKDLAPRKREAVFYNVILDKRQKDVAEIMGITTVSVGQYVESAMIQLAAKYFTEDEY